MAAKSNLLNMALCLTAVCLICAALLGGELHLDLTKLTEEEKDGIYILPSDTPVGVPAKDVLGLDDVVLEFELTANRGGRPLCGRCAGYDTGTFSQRRFRRKACER